MVRTARALETKEFQFRKTITKTSLTSDTSFINIDQLWDRAKDLHIHKIEVECLEYEDPNFESRLGHKGFMYTDLEIDGHTDQRRIATETIESSWLVQDPSETVPNLHSFDSFFLRRDQKLDIALRYERVIDDISNSFKVYGTVKIWYSDDSVPEYQNRRISRVRTFGQTYENDSGETKTSYNEYEFSRECNLRAINGHRRDGGGIMVLDEEFTTFEKNIFKTTDDTINYLADTSGSLNHPITHNIRFRFENLDDDTKAKSGIKIVPECW